MEGLEGRPFRRRDTHANCMHNARAWGPTAFLAWRVLTPSGKMTALGVLPCGPLTPLTTTPLPSHSSYLRGRGVTASTVGRPCHS